MAKWPYSTPEWARLRERKLAANALCEPCMRRGKLVIATTVDHVVSIASGGPAFPTLDGLMSMCASCHNTKTSAVDRPGGSGVRFPGCDASGLPVDPAHPFFGGDTPSKDEGPSALDRRPPRKHTKFLSGKK